MTELQFFNREATAKVRSREERREEIRFATDEHRWTQIKQNRDTAVSAVLSILRVKMRDQIALSAVLSSKHGRDARVTNFIYVHLWRILFFASFFAPSRLRGRLCTAGALAAFFFSL